MGVGARGGDERSYDGMGQFRPSMEKGECIKSHTRMIRKGEERVESSTS